MRAKLVFGSMSPVISSTFSICCLMRSLTRSKRPSAGQLHTEREGSVSIGEAGGLGHGYKELDILEQLGGRSLCDPGARQSLEIAGFCRYKMGSGVDLAQYIVNIHDNW
jgi:hypothetical protein